MGKLVFINESPLFQKQTLENASEAGPGPFRVPMADSDRLRLFLTQLTEEECGIVADLALELINRRRNANMRNMPKTE